MLMTGNVRAWLGVGCLALVLGMSSVAQAAETDLTAAGSQATLTAAIGGTFIASTTSLSASGTGLIDSFLRVNTNADVSMGYNTDARPIQTGFDQDTSPFTSSLLLSAVPIVNIGGVNYREFLLDINQEGGDPALSLNQVQIFQTTNPNLNGATGTANATSGEIAISFGANASLVFQMDAVD